VYVCHTFDILDIISAVPRSALVGVLAGWQLVNILVRELG